jgi:uncharacterized membrane protein YdjX (TVP38/TMEM64 family)
MAIPGLSYAMKNYLLPVCGISFRVYFGIALLTQGMLAIPFVAVGHAAAGKSLFLVTALLLLSISIYGLTYWIKKKKNILTSNQRMQS